MKPDTTVFSINCSKPEIIEDALRGIKKIVQDEFQLAVYPNSGEDWNMEEKGWVPGTLPSHEYFVRLARRWKKVGATMIGGCCRITPDFIQHVSAEINLDPKPTEQEPQLLALGPNPAYQKVTILPELRLNEVNRVQDLNVIGKVVG